PMRILMGAAASPQTYTVVDVDGNDISTGLPPTLPYTASIVPGQNNKIQINVPVSVGPPAVPTAFSFELTISGRPAEGDSFTVAFNTSGVSDNRNALQMVGLQTKSTVGVDLASPTTTGASFTDAYGDLVERVGTLTSQARVDGQATSAILKQATNDRDSVSAVNMDEEAAKLIQFQQYYQASAQIIQVARTLFDTLINTF
ncbi:MAG: flagellar hook-associated protein FlgK, partial [Pseudomonas sp.]|nr:flagellar hook-associated protein FlgK [Pseudomonas sp.]